MTWLKGTCIYNKKVPTYAIGLDLSHSILHDPLNLDHYFIENMEHIIYYPNMSYYDDIDASDLFGAFKEGGFMNWLKGRDIAYMKREDGWYLDIVLSSFPPQLAVMDYRCSAHIKSVLVREMCVDAPALAYGLFPSTKWSRR